MAQIVYSQRALVDLKRLFAFIENAETGQAAVVAIRTAVSMLEHHPLVGRIVSDELRELVISFGKTGYVALYRYVPARQQVRILGVRHQRELDYQV